jgi:hypothetical protein
MSNRLLNQRIVVTTTGAADTAYGTAYGRPLNGEVVRIDWSGTTLCTPGSATNVGSGYFRIYESGGLTSAFIGGSAVADGEFNWCSAKFPMFTASEGSELRLTAGEGSEFVPYYSCKVPYVEVSGVTAGTLTMDLYWIDKR